VSNEALRPEQAKILMVKALFQAVPIKVPPSVERNRDTQGQEYDNDDAPKYAKPRTLLANHKPPLQHIEDECNRYRRVERLMSATLLMLAGFGLLAFLVHLATGAFGRKREKKALAIIEDSAALGDVMPDTLHPVIDPDRCIGSGACVRACPEKQVIELVQGQARLIGPLSCIGHAACAVACPVQAIKVVFGSATRGVELPYVDPNFQTSRQGVYIVGELGGMGLIRNAVMQGKQAADHVLSTSRRAPSPDVCDALIIGAGPAGISAALRLMEKGLRVRLVEREAFGGTIQHYPRAKVVMSGVLDIPMFGKVTQKKMSKEQLLALWGTIRDKTGLKPETGVLVEGLDPGAEGVWEARTNRGTIAAANVFLALGRRGSPRKLGVPGEEASHVHYRLLEPSEFRDQHMLVVGGGDSAVESAIALAEAGGCASVSLSYRRPALARCRKENKERLEGFVAQKKVFLILPSEVIEIHRGRVTLKRGDKLESLKNDAVIAQIGGTAPSELLKQFGVDVVTKFGER
jgi:thioredoxin reductase/NAD-dependent dihydropyrimidine dehydrogenase PreA subunit